MPRLSSTALGCKRNGLASCLDIVCSKTILCCAMLLSTACAQLDTPPAVPVAEGLMFRLLPPAAFGQRVLLTQLVTLQFDDTSRDLLFHTEITGDTLTIVGTLPNGGVRLFSLVFDGATLQLDGSEEILSGIDPAYVLADMQIALWPLHSVSAGLSAADNCLQTGECVLTESSDQLQRSLSRDGDDVISIRYGGIPHQDFITQYRHRQRNYRVQIETLAADYLPEPANP